jgi:hypothetical protein
MISGLHLDQPTAPRRTPAQIAQQRALEALAGIFLQGRPQNEVCALFGLTETQYRLLRSRAEARFGEFTKGSLSHARVIVRKAPTPTAKTKKAKSLAGRLLPIAAHAVAVFGDEQKAAHWFVTPLALFGGRSPEEVFDDKGGPETVDRILTRIEHNIPS